MLFFRLNSSNSSFENSTTSAYEASITAISILRCIPMILISMASFFGNALVLGAIYRFKSLRTFANAYVGSLAITDVMASVVMPLTYTTVLLNGQWVFGDAMCNMQGYFLTMLASASMLTLLVFSMYRCYLVTTVSKRLAEKTVGRIVKCSVCVTWLLAALYAMPPLFGGGQIKYIRTYSSCLLDFTSSRYYAEFLFVFVFTVPLVVMLIAYIRIVKFIKIHNQAIIKSTPKRPRSDVTPSSGPSAEEEKGKRYTVMELKRRLEQLDDQKDMESETKGEGNQQSKESEELGVQAIELQKLKSNNKTSSLSLESEYVSDKIQSYSPQKRAFTRSLDGGARSLNESSPGSLNKISVSTVIQKWRTRAQNRQTVLKQYRKRVTHQARLARILLVTVVAFVVCWAPFSFDSFLRGIGYTDPRPRNFQLTSVWLAYSNALCNPVIYALLNARFRAAFKTLLRERLNAVYICRR